MSLTHTLAVFEALDSPRAGGDTVRALLDGVAGVECTVERVTGAEGVHRLRSHRRARRARTPPRRRRPDAGHRRPPGRRRGAALAPRARVGRRWRRGGHCRRPQAGLHAPRGRRAARRRDRGHARLPGCPHQAARAGRLHGLAGVDRGDERAARSRRRWPRCCRSTPPRAIGCSTRAASRFRRPSRKAGS